MPMLTRRPTSAIQLEWIRACVKDAPAGRRRRVNVQTACERDDCAFAAVALQARRVVPCSTISITCEHLLRHTDYNHTTRRWCRCLDEASNSIWGLGCVPELDGIAQLWANAVSLSSVAPSRP